MRHNRPGVTESPRPGGLYQPRARRRPGAAIALGLWTLVALLWFKVVAGDGDVSVVIWFGSDILTCLVGLAVVIGRTVVGRGDTWQPALITVGASFLGPLSALLLALPPVWRSLRELPAQWRARHDVAPLVPGEPLVREQPLAVTPAPAQPRADATAGVPSGEKGPLRHTPAQAASAGRRGASVALGLVAAALAFWSALLVGLWIGLAGGTMTDGNWFGIGLGIAFIVGIAGFVGVLMVQGWPRVLAGVQYAAAAAMLAAVLCIAAEGDLHWGSGSTQSIGFLYPVWFAVAALFLWGAVVAFPPAAARGS
jgi:hypothetical protein